MSQYTPGKRGTYLYVGRRVRVDREDSWYHGETGTIIGQGRWGHLIVRIVKDGKVFTPEIARGCLEPVQEETT